MKGLMPLFFCITLNFHLLPKSLTGFKTLSEVRNTQNAEEDVLSALPKPNYNEITDFAEQKEGYHFHLLPKLNP